MNRLLCAGGGARTLMKLPSQVFETCASASSATSAMNVYCSITKAQNAESFEKTFQTLYTERYG